MNPHYEAKKLQTKLEGLIEQHTVRWWSGSAASDLEIQLVLNALESAVKILEQALDTCPECVV